MKIVISILMAEDDSRCFHELEQFISDYGRETGQTIHITRYEIGEDLVEHYKPEFDLLLLDVDIPLMNGTTATSPAGPSNFITGTYGTAYPSKVLMAQTWNKKLIHDMAKTFLMADIGIGVVLAAAEALLLLNFRKRKDQQ